MSNRTAKQISKTAALRIAHLAQIEALTAPGLNKHERIRRFADAAGFKQADIDAAHKLAYWCSTAYAVWAMGKPQRSLFAYLPHGCGCPVQAGLLGITFGYVTHRWQPTAVDLELFSRIQIERRFP